MSTEDNRKWWDFKPFGFLPPKEENRIILYVMIGLIIFTFLFLAKFYI